MLKTLNTNVYIGFLIIQLCGCFIVYSSRSLWLQFILQMSKPGFYL